MRTYKNKRLINSNKIYIELIDMFGSPFNEPSSIHIYFLRLKSAICKREV